MRTPAKAMERATTLGQLDRALAKTRSSVNETSAVSGCVCPLNDAAEPFVVGVVVHDGQGGRAVEFVLVHGTTQSPAGWDRLAGALGARGHRVTLIGLPTGQPEWTVTDYAREAAAQAGDPAGRRVAVGHSGAGVLLPAIAGAAQASAAVWLAAYVPDFTAGQSMAEDIKAHRDAMFHPDWLGVDPTSDPQLALRFLFHDCDPQHLIQHPLVVGADLRDHHDNPRPSPPAAV